VSKPVGSTGSAGAFDGAADAALLAEFFSGFLKNFFDLPFTGDAPEDA
jgi:hypothetical protein